MNLSTYINLLIASLTFWKTQAQSDGCITQVKELVFKGQCYDYLLVKKSIMDLDACTSADFFSLLGVSSGDNEGAKIELAKSCKKADDESIENFLPWSAVTKRGYQFDKEFFNGGTILNEEYATQQESDKLEKEVGRLKEIEDNVLNRRGIKWPSYIDNFDTYESCSMNVAMCCWIADRDSVGGGSCEGTDCSDEDPDNNTDVCSHDMGMSPRTAHVEQGKAFFPKSSEGGTHCHAFAWNEDANDLNNKYKGNMLFHVAMTDGLLGNGYVRNLPGAPMCACVEQMPTVSDAKCSKLHVVEHWKLMIENSKLGFKLDSAIITPVDCTKTFASHFEAQYPDKVKELNNKYILGKSCDKFEEDLYYSLGYRSKA
mmetsp:Transcript_6275/g.9115  ORF Transcript_6275/g.9115 Transcript_6275/m.9115 type:complete len:371 (+) Transcript_6275:121-1233(+)